MKAYDVLGENAFDGSQTEKARINNILIQAECEYNKERVLNPKKSDRKRRNKTVVGFKGGIKMKTLEIKKMSRIERLQAMESLWDSLMDEESEMESPEWHRDILEERKRKIETGEAEFISLEKLRASRKS